MHRVALCVALLAGTSEAAFRVKLEKPTSSLTAKDVGFFGGDYDTRHLRFSFKYLYRAPSTHTLSYSGTTTGFSGDLAIPIAKSAVYLHLSGGAVYLHGMRDGKLKAVFAGYQASPLALGYLLSLEFPGTRWFSAGLEVEPVLTLLQFEHVSATPALGTEGQSAFSLGWGFHLTHAFFLRIRRIEMVFGFDLGFDTRYVSFQAAGVATYEGFTPSFVWRPSIGVRVPM